MMNNCRQRSIKKGCLKCDLFVSMIITGQMQLHTCQIAALEKWVKCHCKLQVLKKVSNICFLDSF